MRVQHALAVVARIERREPALPSVRSRREFLVQDRAVVSVDLAQGASELVPPTLRDTLHAGSAHTSRVTAPVAADALALAKFDLGDELKLRAHYVEGRITLAAAPVPRTPGSVDSISASVRAHEVVSAHAPDLCPRLVAHGQLGRGLRYLVEEWLDGAPVLTSQGLAGAAPQLFDGLARIHRGYGVSLVPAGRRWEGLAGRWEATRATGLLPDDVGERVARLVAEGRQVRVSWTHGDLVASNVLRTADGRIVLVDWEHSGPGAVTQDAAKVHLFSAVPEETLDLVLDAWADDAAPDAYPLAQELALAHAVLLSRYPARRAALVGHPRAKVYERQARRHVSRLEQVLERC